MPPSTIELTNFYWHCAIAAKLSDELKSGTVINSYRLLAVRKASDCWAGRNGIQYASTEAAAERDRLGRPRDKCGFIKEHAIPVSVMKSLVEQQLRQAQACTKSAMSSSRDNDALRTLPPSVAALFRQDPRALIVADVVQ